MIDTAADEEPIYGRHYLPRKFKTVVAVPPSNDVDVFAHDLGFIAVTDEEGEVVGYNVTVGGGMGMTHGEPETYPRTADVMGFCRPEQAVAVAEQVVTVQRDYGDRANRKHARLKYTIDDRGLPWFRGEVERRLGYALAEPRPFRFENTGDRYGWVEDHLGNWHYTLLIENGRVKDTERQLIKTGLAAIARVHKGDFRLTANQNLIVASVAPRQKPRIERLLRQYGLGNDVSGLRRNAMACVALPTCALALAESERYLPDLVSALEAVIERAGLRDDEIVIRMTGCPNGCARPYLAEIGLVGRTPGKYNLYLGAAFDGSRLEQALPQGRRPRRDRRSTDPADRELRQRASRRRALRRLRDPRGPRRRDHGRPQLPRQSGARAQGGLIPPALRFHPRGVPRHPQGRGAADAASGALARERRTRKGEGGRRRPCPHPLMGDFCATRRRGRNPTSRRFWGLLMGGVERLKGLGQRIEGHAQRSGGRLAPPAAAGAACGAGQDLGAPQVEGDARPPVGAA